MDQDLTTTSDVTFNDVTVNGDLNLSPGTVIQNSVVRYSTSPQTVADGINIFDTSTVPITANLPDNVAAAGKCFTIVLKTAGNDFTVTAAGTDLIEGSATCVLDIAGQHITVCSCGTGEWIIM